MAQSVFTAKEELEVVMACVSISEGNLGRELRVTVETLPGTAVCKCCEIRDGGGLV